MPWKWSKHSKVTSFSVEFDRSLADFSLHHSTGNRLITPACAFIAISHRDNSRGIGSAGQPDFSGRHGDWGGSDLLSRLRWVSGCAASVCMHYLVTDRSCAKVIKLGLKEIMKNHNLTYYLFFDELALGSAKISLVFFDSNPTSLRPARRL